MEILNGLGNLILLVVSMYIIPPLVIFSSLVIMVVITIRENKKELLTDLTLKREALNGK